VTVFIFPQVPRPAVPTPKETVLPPTLTEFHDFRIAFYMRERTGEVVRLWNMVNHLVALDRPVSNRERRRITLLVLERVKALLQNGFLARWGRKHVTLAGTVAEEPPKRFRIRRRRKQLLRAQRRTAPPVHTSVAIPPTAQNICEQQKPSAVSACAEAQLASTTERKTESDTNEIKVSQRKLATAASEIARLPRKRRRVWTGWIDGVHFWRGRQVQLPDGRVEQVYAVYRNLVGLAIPPSGEFRPRELLFHADQLRVWKNPAAQMLGQAKRDVIERKSLRKAESARLNGCRPVRPGHRPRGRPRK
jgi:hypothetical protein